MHKQTKIAALALAAALLLCACAQQNVQPEPTAKTLPELNIGTAINAPYFYVAKDGSYTGLDKDIADEACARLGVAPVYTVITWGSQDEYLSAGAVDCFWSCFSLLGRENQYQWAGPYMDSPEVVVVAADSDIQTVDDLAGKTVALRIDSNAQLYFVNRPAELQPAVISTFSNMEDAFVSFGQGYTDAVAGHKAALLELTAQQPDLYRYLDTTIITAKPGVAFDPHYDSGFVSALDQTLADMQADGTIAALAANYGLSAADIGEAGAADE